MPPVLIGHIRKKYLLLVGYKFLLIQKIYNWYFTNV